MSHNIQNNEMFSVRQQPWHRQGKVLQNAPNSEEAIREAGLDWLVRASQNHIHVNVPMVEGWEDRYIPVSSYTTYRYDTDGETIIPLGTVTEDYEIVQNVDAFKALDDYLISNGYTYETAGAIFRGKRIWIMCKAPESKLVGDDNVTPYFLLTTGHDGLHNLCVLPTFVRVVCNNTLTYALEGKKQISLVHKKGINNNVRTILDSVITYGFDNTLEIFNIMSKLEISEIEAIKYFQMVEPRLIKRNDETIARNVWKGMFDILIDSFYYGAGNKGRTLWDAYNGITEYVDHRRNEMQSKSPTLEYSQFGAGAIMKQNAYNVAQRIIKDINLFKTDITRSNN